MAHRSGMFQLSQRHKCEQNIFFCCFFLIDSDLTQSPVFLSVFRLLSLIQSKKTKIRKVDSGKQDGHVTDREGTTTDPDTSS